MGTLLSVNDVYASFYTSKEIIKVLNGFSLHLDPGDIVGVVGESGSGKSVAISAIINLLANSGKIDSGEIRFEGNDVLKMSSKDLQQYRCRDIGVIPNNAKGMLHPIITIGDQLANKYLSAHPKAKKEEALKRAIEVLEMVQIPDPEKRAKALPGELSGGMAQRVLIAMALINDPKLLIADDATTGLDVTVQAQILDLIEKQVKERGNSVIMVTHDLGIVAQYCKKMSILCMGRIIESSDSVEELLLDARHPYTRTVFSATPGVPRRYEMEVDSAKSARHDIPKQGCILQDRCRKCKEKCRLEKPEAIEVTKGHFVECHYIDGTEM